VHSLIALCLFGFARSSGRSVVLWPMAGLVGGLLGLAAYIIYAIFDYSQPQEDPYTVLRVDDDALAAHLFNQTDMQGDQDQAIEELISEGYLEQARVQARDKLQASFNYGDSMAEHVYRSYLARIELLAERAPTSL